MTGWGEAVEAMSQGWPWEDGDGPAMAAWRIVWAVTAPSPAAAVLAAGWYLREWRHRQDVQQSRVPDYRGLEPDALLWRAAASAATAEYHRVRGGDSCMVVWWCRDAEAALRTWWKQTGGGAS